MELPPSYLTQVRPPPTFSNKKNYEFQTPLQILSSILHVFPSHRLLLAHLGQDFSHSSYTHTTPKTYHIYTHGAQSLFPKGRTICTVGKWSSTPFSQDCLVQARKRKKSNYLQTNDEKKSQRKIDGTKIFYSINTTFYLQKSNYFNPFKALL